MFSVPGSPFAAEHPFKRVKNVFVPEFPAVYAVRLSVRKIVAVIGKRFSERLILIVQTVLLSYANEKLRLYAVVFVLFDQLIKVVILPDRQIVSESRVEKLGAAVRKTVDIDNGGKPGRRGVLFRLTQSGFERAVTAH